MLVACTDEGDGRSGMKYFEGSTMLRGCSLERIMGAAFIHPGVQSRLTIAGEYTGIERAWSLVTSAALRFGDLVSTIIHRALRARNWRVLPRCELISSIGLPDKVASPTGKFVEHDM